MNFDFKPQRSYLNRPSPKHRSRARRHRLLALLLLILLVAGFFFFMGDQNPHPTDDEVAEVESDPGVPEIRREVVQGAIQPGDTISSMLGHLFTPQEIHDLGQECKAVFPLSKLCAGQGYRLSLLEGSFESLEYDIDQNDQLIIRQGEDGLEIARKPIPYTIKEEVVSGTIMASLFDAVVSSGESELLAVNLADIFAWDINFIRDIQPGDSFQALVEKRYREGEPAGYGHILAATFTNQGKKFQAYLYKDGDRRSAYYDQNGKSLRKEFLKAPLSFTRISSGFTLRRFHPISKKWKAHPAIDYAAPTGTPIMAIGNGTISKIGFTKFNGNFIRLRHANGMESLYLHMSRFAKNMKSGTRVTQGQTIGFVGSTGLATGPHLCFRMTKNGKPINPAGLKTAAAEPISKARLAAFKDSIAPLTARLENPESSKTQKAIVRQSALEKDPEKEPDVQ